MMKRKQKLTIELDYGKLVPDFSFLLCAKNHSACPCGRGKPRTGRDCNEQKIQTQRNFIVNNTILPNVTCERPKEECCSDQENAQFYPTL